MLVTRCDGDCISFTWEQIARLEKEFYRENYVIQASEM